MKFTSLVLILLISFNVIGQETYFSPMTEYLNTGEKEWINRTITIEEDFIQIKTQIESGFDIQVLKILSKRLNQDTNPPILIYDCTSTDGVYPTLIFIPQREIVTEIIAIQPSLVDGSDENYRFHLNSTEEVF